MYLRGKNKTSIEFDFFLQQENMHLYLYYVQQITMNYNKF